MRQTEAKSVHSRHGLRLDGAGLRGPCLAVAILAGSLPAAGCTEAHMYAYVVWNYSPDAVFVLVTFENGSQSQAYAPPEARVSRATQSPPKSAVVYDAACSRRFATVSFPSGATDVVIDQHDSVSVPSSPPKDGLKIGEQGSLPHACASIRS